MFNPLVILNRKSFNPYGRLLEAARLARSKRNSACAKINDEKRVVSKRIVLIRTDDGKGPRITKESRTLSRGGFRVIILAWDRKNALDALERDEEGVIIKRLKLLAPQNSIVILPLLPIFILWSLVYLIVISPDVVHATDLDSAIPAYLYKQIARRTSFVFDVFDRYAWRTATLCNIRFLFEIINLVEELLASRADLFITVSMNLLATFCRFEIKRSMILYNVTRKEDIRKVLSQTPVEWKKGELRIYISHLTEETALLARSVRGLNDVRIIVTGNVFLDKSAVEAILHSSSVEYHGFLPYLDALKIENTADVFALLYSPHSEISRYRLSGNRFFEALLMNKLVLTNIWDPYIYERIRPYIKIDYDEDAIRKAVQDLIKTKKTQRNLIENMPSSFRTKNMYCWEAMEQKLVNAYKELIR